MRLVYLIHKSHSYWGNRPWYWIYLANLVKVLRGRKDLNGICILWAESGGLGEEDSSMTDRS